MRKAITGASLIIASLLSAKVRSQPVQNCADALVPDINDIRTDIQLLSSFLQTINESNFQSKKSSLAFQTAFIVYGIPFDNSTDYSKFDQTRNEFYKKTQYSQSFRDASTYLMQKVPAEAFEQYGNCINAQLQNQIGPHFIPKRVSDSLIILKLVWTAPPGQTVARVVWNNYGVKPQGPLPEKVLSNGNYSVILKRINGQDAAVAITVADMSTSFDLPFVKPFTVPKPKKDKFVRARNYKTEGPDRQSVSVNCPDDYRRVQNGTCLLSVSGPKLIENSGIGTNGWRCTWDSWQPVGIALDVQLDCELDEPSKQDSVTKRNPCSSPM